MHLWQVIAGFNLDIALQIVSIVLTVVLAGIGIEMANNPPSPADKVKKWRYRGWFIFVGLLLVSVNYWQAARNAAEQLAIKKKAEGEQEKIEAKFKEVKTQYDNVQGQLTSISNFVQNPPSNLTPQQVIASIRSMAGPRLRQGEDEFGEFTSADFIVVGERNLECMQRFVQEQKENMRSPVYANSGAPIDRLLFKQFMDMCFQDAVNYRKEALARLARTGNPKAESIFNKQNAENLGPAVMEDIYTDIKSLIAQLEGKPKLDFSLE